MKKEAKKKLIIEQQAEVKTSLVYISLRNLRTSDGEFKTGDEVPESNKDLAWLIEKKYVVLSDK